MSNTQPKPGNCLVTRHDRERYQYLLEKRIPEEDARLLSCRLFECGHCAPEKFLRILKRHKEVLLQTE